MLRLSGLRPGYRLAVEVGQGLGEVIKQDVNGYPAIAVAHHTRPPLGCCATEQDRWVRLLYGLWVGDNALESDKLSSVRCLLLSPDRFHRLNALAQHLPPQLKWRAMMRHFLAIPPPANAEKDPAVRQPVQRGDRLGQHNGIMFD